MKALLVKQPGLPETLVVEEVADPVPGDHEAVVDVHAAGVNFPDTLIIQGKYQFKPPFPFSPGGECAGVVSRVGAAVKNVKPGDRVMAMTIHGAFAEKIAVRSESLVPMPPGLDFATAAAFMMTYGTSYHALVDRGALEAGESVLVLGASGGVGLAAVEIARVVGARVIAAASSGEKLAVCREHGADELIDYSREDLRERIKALTDGQGVNVVYDPVGGIYTEPALRSTAWRGRLLVVGFANGEIPRIPLNLPLLKGCSIVGVFWGAFTRTEAERNRRNNEALMQLYLAGKVKPHIHATYPLERAAQALNEVLYKRVSGKVVLTVG